MGGHSRAGGIVGLVAGESGVHTPMGGCVVQWTVVHPWHAELRAGHVHAHLRQCRGSVREREGATHALGRGSRVQTCSLLQITSWAGLLAVSATAPGFGGD